MKRAAATETIEIHYFEFVRFSGISLASFIFLLTTALAVDAEVGKREEIEGTKSATPATENVAPSIRVGTLRLTAAASQAWKTTPLAELTTAFPEGKSLYVIGNFSGSKDDLKAEIAKLGDETKIIDESLKNATVIYTDKAAASQLAQVREKPGVDIVAPLSARQKMTAELRDQVEKAKTQLLPQSAPNPGKNLPQPLKLKEHGAAPALAHAGHEGAQPLAIDPKISVMIYLFKDQPLEEVSKQISDAGGQVIKMGSDNTVSAIRAQIPASKVETVTASPAVREATPAPHFIKHNDQALIILSRNPPAWVPPIHGAGQIAGHSDSGLDNGKNDSTLSPAFQGRLKKAFALGRPAPHADWSDVGGHGTHTAGSILGAGKFPGIAPECQLVHQSLDDDEGELNGIPAPLGKLFLAAYDEGARVHSNSWGVSAIDESGENTRGGVYDQGKDIDLWTWNGGAPRDMLIVFSAGNDGDFATGNGRMTVTSPGTAKNCLTVGASETVRPNAGDYGDNKDELAFFSSKGPTRENRIKPDVVAPGTWIASAKTHGAKNPWKDDVESVQTTPGSASSWTSTTGFNVSSHPAGGAHSGNQEWELKRTSGTNLQDILSTPTILIPTGHSLTFEFRIRGDARGLDRLAVGYSIGNSAFVIAPIATRKYPNWVVVSTSLPRELPGNSVRFLIVAEKTGTLTTPVDVEFDDFDLTTVGTWGALSSLDLAEADDANDSLFMFDSGTSMAAPLCAGCAVLVRQSLVDAGTTAPSAELVKAILINTADVSQGARPNFQWGWGLVNLRRAVEQDFKFDFKTKLKQNESNSYNIPVAASVKQLRATLVWADAPGAALVNDLDLKLTSPSNVDTVAADADDNQPDRTNNVEGIDKKDPETGTWKATVTAHKVTPGLSQPYAIVFSQIK